MKKQPSISFSWLLFLAIWGFGGILLASRFSDAVGAVKSRNTQFATTTGKIDSGQIYRRRSGKGRGGYHYRVSYSYVVGGNVLVNHRINFALAKGSRDGRLARQDAQKYPTGAAVTVFYDPKNPAFSVLEPQGSQSMITMVLMILGAMFISLWIVCWQKFVSAKDSENLEPKH